MSEPILNYKLDQFYIKYLPVMLSVFLHAVLVLLYGGFFFQKINHLTKTRVTTKEPMHAVIINEAAFAAHAANGMNQQLAQQLISENPQYKQLTENQKIINEYQIKIIKAIAAQWVKLPNNTDRSLYCIYTIYLAPSGDVMGVKLVQGSGDPALDHAAETAIYRASPLPVPSDPVNFSPFRRFTLQLIPQQQY